GDPHDQPVMRMGHDNSRHSLSHPKSQDSRDATPRTAEVGATRSDRPTSAAGVHKFRSTFPLGHGDHQGSSLTHSGTAVAFPWVRLRRPAAIAIPQPTESNPHVPPSALAL